MSRSGEVQHTVSVTLTRRQYVLVTDLAARDGVTKASIVRRALERYLATSPHKEALVSPGRPWELDDD